MTKIEEDCVFVHASDIQLLNNESVSQIVSWKPDIVITSGPPLYLLKLSKDQIRKAWYNASRLSEKVDTLLIDHHLLRDDTGIQWLRKLSSTSNKNILCGADFMNKPRLLLEARRKDLYEQMPVPEGWHEAYGQGKVNTDDYWNLAKKKYNNIKLYNEK
jgi:predicted metallo-beta-lactamase superfamily hydrolase